MMSILRFIQFNSSLIGHSHYALSILYSLSSYSILNSQLLNLFLKSCLSLSEQFELMHSFVEFLEFDDDGELSAEQTQLASFKSNVDSIDLGDGMMPIGMATNGTTPRSTRKNLSDDYVETESARSQCRLQVRNHISSNF